MTLQPATAPPVPAPVMPRAKRRPHARWSPSTRAALAVSIVVVLVCVAGAGWKYLLAPGRSRADLVVHVVERETLVQTIVERGEMQSADNNDIYNRVNHEALCNSKTSIKWLIEDGKHVKKGDRLMVLDSSKLEDLLRTQGIIRDKAENEYIFARSQLQSITIQGATERETARRNVRLARGALEKYRDGDYPQLLKELNSKIDLAEGDLEQTRDYSAYAERMEKKKFMSYSQAKAALSKLLSAEEGLRKLKLEREVLVKFTNPQTMLELQGKFDEAEAILRRTLIQSEAQETQARNDLKTKEATYQVEKNKFDEIKKEMEHCTITAPEAGLVVYFVSQQSRRGSGGQQSIIAEGEQVFLGQKLMQIPDLSRMVVSTRVHEALISKVKPGQRALLRPHAFPHKVLNGTVESVANVASQQDWFSGDVKVYEAMVSIDAATMAGLKSPGLKPGMSAEVTIFTEVRAENVLTVPVQAVVRVPGADINVVYVLTPAGPKKREVVVGISNDKRVAILEGLMEGEEVVLNVDILQQDRNAGGGDEKDPKNRKDGKRESPQGKPQS